ncbi:MAG: DUF3108 domain-containing protein [Ignavibacteria bacterium]|nr:DUF3108 domain-containing protein [Ignavibacteria bacterium]MBK9228416.1 DUF3108 domain-containing protein [Ignavibacteria bacterium]
MKTKTGALINSYLRIVGSFVILSIMFLQSAEAQEKVLYEGEELKYVVYYGFIELGEVKMKLVSIRESGNVSFVTASCEMRSYSGIPFVELESKFESDMIYKDGEIYSREFRAIDKKKEGTVEINYKFEYDSGFVKILKKFKGKVEIDKRMEFDKNLRFQDGLSLFYQARLNSFKTDSRMIPVLMNESETSVNYYFSSLPEEIDFEKRDMDVLCVKCSGMANFVGIFGLSGEFAGWFSKDYARVPISAQMNVIVGNINLELDSYTRKDWQP